ncbi:MAG: sugar phosphate isomerase/epimerase [Candidatus Hydrogenedentes bacterium]|nr:sugar phosphate isomerase/epimerase [Candidatus Hydrogenedentota bacterium]
MKTYPRKKLTHNRRDFLKIAGASSFATGLATVPQADAASGYIKGFSCIPLNFYKELGTEKTMSFEDWVRMAVEFGLDGIEVYDPFLHDRDAAAREKLSDFIYESGLKVSQFTIESDLCDPKDHERTIPHIKRSIEKAKVFRTNIVRVVSGHGSKGRDHEDVLRAIADGLRAGLDYAEENQVMLAYEDHWEVGTNLKDFLRILELVDDDRLKVNLDTGNVVSEDIVELTERVVHRIVHTHVSEHGKIIGRGDLDIRGIFKVLKGFGYNGWISLEPLQTRDGGYGKEALQFSVNHVKKEWELA